LGKGEGERLVDGFRGGDSRRGDKGDGDGRVDNVGHDDSEWREEEEGRTSVKWGGV